MDERIPIAITLLVLALPAGSVRAQQERFWIALNFDVAFAADGTTVVKVKEHPFDLRGRSLIEDEEVVSRLMREEEGAVRDVLLMFASDPTKVRYDVLSHFSLMENETVLCDALNRGEMDEFDGAVVLRLRVYLNTSEFLRDLGGGRYEVTVRDSFTSIDPRSWIDVISFEFGDGVEVVNFTWEPTSAHGPTQEGERYLLWENYNEPEAPDRYVFLLGLPNFVAARAGMEVSLSGRISGSEAVVEVVNRGGAGSVILRVSGGGEEQARKIYLEAGEVLNLTFPATAPTMTVQALSNGEVIAETTINVSEGEAGPEQAQGGGAGPPTWMDSVRAILLLSGVAAVVGAFALPGEGLEGEKEGRKGEDLMVVEV